jgi:hypothetical protein
VSGSSHIKAGPTILRAAPNETLKFPVEPPSPWLSTAKSGLLGMKAVSLYQGGAAREI